MRSRRPLISSLLLGCTVLLTASCSESVDTTIQFPDKPLWEAAEFGVENLNGVEFRGDTALISSAESSGAAVIAVDLPSGRVLWSAADGDPLVGGEGVVAHGWAARQETPPLVRDLGDGEWEVLIAYRTVESPSGSSSDSTVGYGIAALSGADGQVTWRSDALIENAGKPQHAALIEPRFVDDETVVAVSEQGDESGSLTTWALESGDGSTRWSKDGVWPTALASGNVLTEQVPDSRGVWHTDGPEREETDLEAFDERTGEAAWSLADRFETSRVEASSGNYAVVVAEEAGGQRDKGESKLQRFLVRADSAEAIEEFEPGTLCYASSSLIACGEREKLLTFGSTDAPSPHAESSRPFGGKNRSVYWDILSVHDDTVIIGDHSDDDHRVWALDPQGRSRADDLGSAPNALSDDYAVFCRGLQADCAFYAQGVERPSGGDAAIEPLELGERVNDLNGGSSSMHDLTRVWGIDLMDDALVLYGRDRTEDRNPFLILDARTEQLRWSIDESTSTRSVDGQQVTAVITAYGTPEIVRGSDQWWMLLPASTAADTGVVALNGADGEAAWYLPLASQDAELRVSESTDSHAAVRIVDGQTTTTAVVDLGRHQEVWRLDNTEPLRITDDLVIIEDHTGQQGGSDSPKVSAVPLTAAPDPQWTVAVDGGTAPEVQASGDFLLARMVDGTAIIDLDSGEEKARIGKVLSGCVAEDAETVCNSTVDDGLNTPGSPIVLREQDGEVETRELRSTRAQHIYGIHEGRIFLDQPGDKDVSLTIDTEGRIIDRDIPGRYRNMTSDGLLLLVRGPALADLRWEVFQTS